MNQGNPAKTFRQMRMICHILQGFGYQRAISLDSFRKPNFILVADILFWLCGKLETNHGISPNINGEAERINFIKQSLSLIVSKIRVNIDPINIYYSDYRCIPELLKILQLLYDSKDNNKEILDQGQDFTLPLKFDKRKTKDIIKEIIHHGQELYEILGKENSLENKMNFSIEILEKVLKDYNQSTGFMEDHIKKLVLDQNEINEEIISYMKKLEKKETDLIDRIRRKKLEGERLEKKLKTLSNFKPAYVEKMERYEKELERIFQVYVNKMRNLDYLENTFDKINLKEKEKNKSILNYLEKMQVQIQKNEEKMFENNINDLHLQNMNNFKHKFQAQNTIIEVEEKGEDDEEDYAFQQIQQNQFSKNLIFIYSELNFYLILNQQMESDKNLIMPSKELKIESLQDEHCSEFLKKLQNMEKIEIFCLMGNSYGKQFFEELLKFKDQIKEIKHVILKDIFTSRKEEILDSLSFLNDFLQNKNIILFDLSSNAICPDGCLRIKDIFKTNSTIKYLYLNHVALSEAGTVTITEQILNSELNLKSFQATKNRIETQATKLSEIFERMTELEEVILWQNNIKGIEMKNLLIELGKCKNLKKIDLSDNYLYDDYIQPLLEVIKNNTNLQELRIADCNISEEGSKMIMEFFKNNQTKIHTLTYNYNEVEDSEEFVQSLQGMSLKRLEIKDLTEENEIIQKLLPECKILFESEEEDDDEKETQETQDTQTNKNLEDIMKNLDDLKI